MPRDALRKSHIGIRLGDQSSSMELRMAAALELFQVSIRTEFGLSVAQQRIKLLSEIVGDLNARYEKDIRVRFETGFRGLRQTWIKPDGGFWYVTDWGEPARYILVAEAKRQGTNVARLKEGLPKQSRGNAVERLGKNMRGIDAMFLGEAITPFVCFGEGDDFAEDSSILDRVSTLNSFFPLNRVFVDKITIGGDTLKPTSLFFREEPWTPKEMLAVMLQVAGRAISYYRSEYGLA